jgi:tubulin polyglutamylase TTLL6/13
MHCLARKENLAKNLMRMRKMYPREYSFFPVTWCIPRDYNDLKGEFSKGKTYIVKPEASCQGKGIYLIRSLKELDANEHYVVQKYIKDPYLIDGLKFDIRIYVLVYGCDPLRVFIHKQGLARLATEKYEVPTKSNIENVYMHLTNYAINKSSENFVFNKNSEKADIGHKRSLELVWSYIDLQGGNSDVVQKRIRRCVVKSLCAVQPHLSHSYRTCQPSDIENSMCFEILGYDIMLDSNLKPWLLEVNHASSFETDTPFDHEVKYELIAGTIKILNVSYNNRLKYNHQKEKEYMLRF